MHPPPYPFTANPANIPVTQRNTEASSVLWHREVIWEDNFPKKKIISNKRKIYMRTLTHGLNVKHIFTRLVIDVNIFITEIN